jgi:hypothetical protein
MALEKSNKQQLDKRTPHERSILADYADQCKKYLQHIDRAVRRLPASLQQYHSECSVVGCKSPKCPFVKKPPPPEMVPRLVDCELLNKPVRSFGRAGKGLHQFQQRLVQFLDARPEIQNLIDTMQQLRVGVPNIESCIQAINVRAAFVRSFLDDLRDYLKKSPQPGDPGRPPKYPKSVERAKISRELCPPTKWKEVYRQCKEEFGELPPLSAKSEDAFKKACKRAK